MKKKSLTFVLIIFIAQVFYSCEKDTIAPTGKIGDPSLAEALINKVTYNGVDTLYDLYSYNEKNEVVRIATYSIYNPDSLSYRLFFYDNDSRLTKTEYYADYVDYQLIKYETYNWESDKVTQQVYSVNYDGQNKIGEEIQTKYVYELNEKLETTRKREYWYASGQQLFEYGYTDYTWKGGNVTQRDIWIISEEDINSFEHGATVTIKYDDHANPYRFLSNEILAKPYYNNIVEMKYSSDPYLTTYEYEYNEFGYIKSRLRRTVNLEDPSDLKEEAYHFEYIRID